MKITYHGYFCLTLEMENGQHVMIDPLVTGSPLSGLTAEKVKTDWLLITHRHSDHIGDTIPVAEENRATIISIVEVADYANSRGVDSLGMNIGGRHVFPFGAAKLVHTQHSSSYEVDGIVQYTDEPNGIIIQVEGRAIYHVEDAAYFSDLGLLAERFDTDVASLPVGNDHVMRPEDVARAVQTIRVKKVVPIHFSTFSVIEQNSKSFVASLEDSGGKTMGVSGVLEV